jgi:hypothetical protein
MITPEELAAEAEAAFKKHYVSTGNALIDSKFRRTFHLGFANGMQYCAKYSTAMIKTKSSLLKIKMGAK